MRILEKISLALKLKNMTTEAIVTIYFFCLFNIYDFLTESNPKKKKKKQCYVS